MRVERTAREEKEVRRKRMEEQEGGGGKDGIMKSKGGMWRKNKDK